MKSYFDKQFFAGNRQSLRNLFTGTAPIVISANGLLQRGGDSTYPFSQDASFWYLTGLNEPDLILVMDKDEEYLIVPNRSHSRETFDGSINSREVFNTSGIKQILDYTAGWEKLSGRLDKVKHVATLSAPPAYIEHFGMYVNPAREAVLTKIKNKKPAIELLDISQHITRLRMLKQPQEIKAIQAAIDITLDTLEDVLRNINDLKYEFEVEASLSSGFRARGAAGHGFSPIVASGARACTLHYIANDGNLEANKLVVVDVGAEVEHYSADITRTYCRGKPTVRQKQVFSAVLDAQNYAFNLLKPGLMLKEYEQKMEEYIGLKLKELGLIKTINHQNVRRYFPHATSHFLGLNVHDIGDYNRPLEEGMVLTVEPGIYIAKEGIGVRIEDDVLITKNGNKILSDKLSRELA